MTVWSAEKIRAAEILVIGFYTPNYKSLADRLAADCYAHVLQAKFYSVSSHEWASAILLKPTIIQKARSEFPNATLVLMDVDCRIHGRLTEIESIHSDVALHQRCKIASGLLKSRSTIWPSSRILVVKPTAGAARLIEAWRQACASHRSGGDELMLAQAISQTPGVSISMLPVSYAAFEAGEAPDGAVVVHHSAHDASRGSVKFWKGIKRARRAAMSWVLGADYRARKYMSKAAS